MANATPRIRLLSLVGGLALSITALHSVAVQQVPADQAVAVFTQCADGIDNDHDGLIDYPQDPQCLSLHDDSEGPTGRGLFIAVSDSVDTVKAGDNVSYTITLRSEREEQQLVDVYFQMPHQTNLVSASDGGTRSAELIVWRNIAVHPGVARKLYVNVGTTPYATEGLLLVAEVTSGGEKSTDVTRVEAGEDITNQPQLKLVITDGKKYAQPGEKLTYKITVTNPDNKERTYDLRAALPEQTLFVSATGAGRPNTRAVSWSDQTIGPKQSREYTMEVRIEKDAQEFVSITNRASIGAVSDTDTTTVHTGILPSTLNVTVDDGLETTAPGNLVTYNIVINNTTEKLATEVDVNNALPGFVEFVSATEGGHWFGKNVRWTGLTVSPFGQRTLQVTGRVRSDAELGQDIRNSVLVKGFEAVDHTRIGAVADAGGYGQVSNDVLVTKTASKSEVRPGDTVRYTVTVRNVTNNVLRNIDVTDRMDTPHAVVVSGNREGTIIDPTTISWMIPQLAPGQTWDVSYTVQISPNAPHGVTIPNIVTVSGEGMERVALTERIHTMQIGVITSLPPTGATFDAIFLTLTSLMGIAPAAAMRRKMII